MILKNYRQVFGSCPKNTIFAVILLTKNNQLMDLGAFGAFGALFGLVLMLVGFAWTIFCIILMFKVWGMCNDVRSILDNLRSRNYSRDPQ
jgi:uncharacterized membrane protein